MDNKFSFYKAPITNVVPVGRVSLREVYEMIISDKYFAVTCELRRLYQCDRAGYAALKKRSLDFVTFACQSYRRGPQGVEHLSGYLCLDIDHVGSEELLQHLKQCFVTDPVLGVRLIFRSPSGDGFKVIIQLQQTTIDSITQHHNPVERYRSYYEHVRSYVSRTYGIVVDHTSDLQRACFLCYDEDAYFDDSLRSCQESIVNSQQSTDNGQQMNHFVRVNGQQTTVINDEWRPSTVDRRPSNDWDSVEALVRGIEQAGVDITGNYHQWMRIGFSLASAFGEGGRGFYHRVSRFYSGYSNVECNRQYDRCLRARGGGVGLGTFIYLARAV